MSRLLNSEGFRTFSSLIAAFALVSALGAQAPPTVEQFLASKHVANTEPALAAALYSKDAMVRGFAAGQLVELHSSRSLPLIKGALLHERDPRVRFNMARALIELHDPQGIVVRDSICADDSADGDLRIQVADELLPDLDQPCALAVAGIVATLESDPMLLAGLTTLTRTRLKAAVKLGARPVVLAAVTKGLNSSVDPVRIQAAKCATVLQVRGARPVIQRALGRESDLEARRVMQAALQVLPD